MIGQCTHRLQRGLYAGMALLLSTAPAGAQWTAVGNATGVSAAGSSHQYLTRDAAGNLYLAYQDSAATAGSVMKYNGSAWSYAGGSAGITAGNTMYNGLAVNASGDVFYGYQDIANGNKISVKQFNGTAWTNTWQNVSTGQAYSNSMKTGPSGYPYQLSRDLTANGMSVKRYNGTGWARLGTAAFGMSGVNYYPAMVIGSNDTVYVSSVTPLSTVQVHSIYALTDSTTAWQPVGTTGFATTTTNSIFQMYSGMAIDAANSLYVVYTSPAAEGNKLKVKKYANGAWISVGADNFTPGSAAFVSIAVTPSGTPYVAFSDGNAAAKTTVMKYDGTQWVIVGTAGFSAGAAKFNTLTLDAAGNPIVAFSDAGNGNKTVVMKYTPACTNTDPGATPGSTGCITFTYRGNPVSYATVRGADGNIWLQQNLGSPRVAASMTDTGAFGDTFQWGRWDDGHQARTAAAAPAPLPNDPSGLGSGTNNFYTGTPSWWTGGALTDTWAATTAAGVAATNGCDPCKAIGTGWHLPTQAEWAAAIAGENATTQALAFGSNLKLPMAGNRSASGAIDFAGARGYYWSSTTSSTGGKYLYCGTTIINPNAGGLRGQGMSIRCLKAAILTVDSVKVGTLGNVPATITTNGGTLQMTATVYPAAMNQSVTWSVVPVTGTATIAASGLVTAQTNGTVWAKAVSVADTLKKDSLLLTISNQIIPADSLRVRVAGSGPAVIGTRGGTLQLQAMIYPVAAGQAVTWSLIAVTGSATISNTGLVTAQTNGTVWAKATAVQYPALKDSLEVTISNQNSTAIGGAAMSPMLKIYPNPTEDRLYLQSGRIHPALVVKIQDMQGRTILQRDFAANELKAPVPIDIAACPAGTYLLVAEGDGIRIRQMIRKQ